MTYKQFILPVLLAAATPLAAQQGPFTLDGKVEGKTDAWIYLNYAATEDAKPVIDSALIRNGKFSFSGEVSGITSAYLLMDKYAPMQDRKYLSAYLVPGKMRVAIKYDNFSDGLLTGSSAQDEINKRKKMEAPVIARLKPYNEAYDKANMAYIKARQEGKDEATLAKMKEAANAAKDAGDPIREELSAVHKQFMDKYPASFATAEMLRYMISSMKPAEAQARYDKLPESIRSASMGKTIKNEIDKLKKGSPGAIATNFSSEELKGGTLSLSDYKGKYVLVDFWASWCVPCRKGNPHLLSLYSKYKDKGFEIIGISDDDSKPENWRKAVEQDGIGVWKHVLRGLKQVNGQFDRNNDISDNFGIHTLPTKILIDGNGKIIGRYGGGGENDEAMDKKLAEIFGS